MVAVAQLVEHRVVVAGVAGSSPVSHPTHGPGIVPGPFFVSADVRGRSPECRGALAWAPEGVFALGNAYASGDAPPQNAALPLPSAAAPSCRVQRACQHSGVRRGDRGHGRRYAIHARQHASRVPNCPRAGVTGRVRTRERAHARLDEPAALSHSGTRKHRRGPPHRRSRVRRRPRTGRAGHVRTREHGAISTAKAAVRRPHAAAPAPECRTAPGRALQGVFALGSVHTRFDEPAASPSAAGALGRAAESVVTLGNAHANALRQNADRHSRLPRRPRPGRGGRERTRERTRHRPQCARCRSRVPIRPRAGHSGRVRTRERGADEGCAGAGLRGGSVR